MAKIKKEKIVYKKRLSALFAWGALLLVGATSLLDSMSLDYYSVMGTFQKAIPACVVLGAIGWLMGTVLDMPKRGNRIGYSNSFINQMVKENSDLGSLSDSAEDTSTNEGL